jgi:hypothetical protein
MTIRKCITAGIILIWMSLSCSGVLVVLRDGTKIRGDEVSRDNKKIVLKTEAGEKSIEWRKMKISCFKLLNPDLYEELKRRRDDRIRKKEDAMQAKGLVKVGNKWIKKEEAEMLKYKWARMKVTVNEKKPSFKTHYKSGGSDYRNMSRECYLLATVEFEGLHRTNDYELTIKLQNHLKYRGASSSSISSDTRSGQKIEKKVTISGQSDYTGEFKTKAYEQSKTSYSSYHGRETHIYGYESDGHDLEIYLDGKLVYEDKKGSSPEYHIITRM